MRTVFAVLIVLVAIAGCSGGRGAAIDPAPEPDPVRVLVVTATHGFRHGDAIAASREVLAAAADSLPYVFSFTEDVADLNAATLAGYDVLFLNNATLRVREGDGEEPWGIYDVTLDTPEGRMEAETVLTGTAGDLSGTIGLKGDEERAELERVEFDGETLRFAFRSPEYGAITATYTLDGDSVSGTMDVSGAVIGVSGQRVGGTNGAGATVLVTEAQRQAILDFVASGKGLAVAHSGLDAFYEWDAYRELVGGGLFEEHPWTQEVRVVVEEKGNPAVAHWGDGFEIHDEIYVLDENPRWNSKVLLSLDMDSVEPRGDPAGYERNDYPISWVRPYRDGQVFVTKLGHFADVWRTPGFQQHLLAGLRIAAGRTDVDVTGRLVKETIAENVWPDDIAIDDSGNVWIAELRGKVHRYDAATGATALLGTLETTDPTKIEHGLYGLEVDPDFYSGSPYIYLYYAEPETFINTLARFRYADGRLDFANPDVLLRVPTEPNCCHQAGDLEWGPDGTLYLSTGDTGMSETRPDWEISEEAIEAFTERHELTGYHWSRLVDSERTAQNLADLRGKILRINKDGSIPHDNPFFGTPGVRWEVYAYGLRNPYRFKVDDQTGRLYIGVVGPDAAYDYDEYNVSVEGGENFGWPRTLGRLFMNEWTPERIPNYRPPMWEYTYQTGGRSATVGPVYRHEGPGAFPPAFQDKLFVFDWSRGWIKWGAVEDGTFTNDTEGDVKQIDHQVAIPAQRLTDIKTMDVLRGTRPISMELGPDGSIYVAEFDGFWDAGPRAKVTRYRWVTGRPAAAVPPSND